MNAHLTWPITGLAIDSRRGALAILDAATLKLMDSSLAVRTVAGNNRQQPQLGRANWDSRYMDTMTGEILDVFVRGDREVEIGSSAAGIFEVRQGLRSLAADTAQFWNAPSYVRIGAAKYRDSPDSALRSLRCGAFIDYGRKNPESKYTSRLTVGKPLFLAWYSSFGPALTPDFLESARCAKVRVTDALGRIVYEDDESRLIPHAVPDGLIEYVDQRTLYH
ncbi:MAG: hypothetical protein ACXVAG_11745 [Vulcanimicrobiaceae bacterium]